MSTYISNPFQPLYEIACYLGHAVAASRHGHNPDTPLELAQKFGSIGDYQLVRYWTDRCRAWDDVPGFTAAEVEERVFQVEEQMTQVLLAMARGKVDEAGALVPDLRKAWEAIRTLALRCEPAAPPPSPADDISHSEDFHSVKWYGTEHTFTTTQAACVEVLWEAWKKGTPEMSQAKILEKAGSAGRRLRDVFDEGPKGMNPAWGKMIAKGKKGSYRLSPPI